MTFSDLKIGQRGTRPNGTFFKISGLDPDDQTIMDEFGTWYDFDDCFFSED